MQIIERKLKGVFEISLNPLTDERGFFMRTYDIDIFREAGLHREWVQENHSRSEKKGIIRGLHFQLPPFTETKLLRCIRGSVMDVFVDLREGSESFGKWDSIELSELNKKMIFIPRGFAHGFYTLTEISEVVYKVDNFYSKQHEAGIKWNDEVLKITWPGSDVFVSEKDDRNMRMKEFVKEFKSITV
jgi:dTDP-4-dehydrorhamnose 3,5-epimerase